MKKKGMLLICALILAMFAGISMAKNQKQNGDCDQDCIRDCDYDCFCGLLFDMYEDGICDFCYGNIPNGPNDADGDGIPNGEDPDYERPADGTGYQFGRNI